MIDSIQFANMQELVAYCAARPDSKSSLDIPSKWNGNITIAQTLELATKGWDAGLAKIAQFSAGLVDVLGSKLVLDEYYYDVTGQDFDLSRVLEGEPECWLNSEQVHVDAPHTSTLKLVVNIGASASMDAKRILCKGAAIVALVQLLEKTRRSVEVVAITRDKGSWQDPNDGFNFDLTLKNAGSDLDLAKLSFALMHPAMLRRLQFIAMENEWKNIPLASYGYSSDERKPACDIYVGASQVAYGHFNSTESVKQWILGILKEQGIELKEEMK